MTIVFMLPTRKRNDSGDLSSDVLESSEETRAACPEPKPGRKDARGAVREEEIKEGNNCFGFSFGLERDCLGIFIDEFRETKRVERPKSPVKRGRRGDLMGRSNVNKPRKPERMKTERAMRNSDSLNMRYIEANIKRKGSRGEIMDCIVGRKNIKIGMKIRIGSKENREP
jgi:hypothetical protein